MSGFWLGWESQWSKRWLEVFGVSGHGRRAQANDAARERNNKGGAMAVSVDRSIGHAQIRSTPQKCCVRPKLLPSKSSLEDEKSDLI